MSKLDTANEYLDELNKVLDKTVTDIEAQRKTRTPNPPSVRIAKGLTGTALCVLWGTGIVVAKGFWWTTCALLIPFVGPGTAVYWIVERLTSA